MPWLKIGYCGFLVILKNSELFNSEDGPYHNPWWESILNPFQDQDDIHEEDSHEHHFSLILDQDVERHLDEDQWWWSWQESHSQESNSQILSPFDQTQWRRDPVLIIWLLQLVTFELVKQSHFVCSIQLISLTFEMIIVENYKSSSCDKSKAFWISDSRVLNTWGNKLLLLLLLLFCLF